MYACTRTSTLQISKTLLIHIQIVVLILHCAIPHKPNHPLIWQALTDPFLCSLYLYLVTQSAPVDVSVVSHPFQRFAVWFGGSMLASSSEFFRVVTTKAQYEEEGPRVARYSPVFNF